MNAVFERGMQAAKRYIQACKNAEPIGTFDNDKGFVFLDEDEMVFALVKARSYNSGIGFPEERITPSFRQRAETAAAEFLASYCLEHPETVSLGVRFDIIGVLFTGPDHALIRHHVNALQN